MESLTSSKINTGVGLNILILVIDELNGLPGPNDQTQVKVIHTQHSRLGPDLQIQTAQPLPN